MHFNGFPTKTLNEIRGVTQNRGSNLNSGGTSDLHNHSGAPELWRGLEYLNRNQLPDTNVKNARQIMGKTSLVFLVLIQRILKRDFQNGERHNSASQGH